MIKLLKALWQRKRNIVSDIPESPLQMSLEQKLATDEKGNSIEKSIAEAIRAGNEVEFEREEEFAIANDGSLGVNAQRAGVEAGFKSSDITLLRRRTKFVLKKGL